MAFSLTGSQIMEPCQSADKIVYDHLDLYTSFWTTDSVFIWAEIQFSKFKVIEHKRAYGIQSLIGNTGGYVGLFLGRYSMCNNKLCLVSIKTKKYK